MNLRVSFSFVQLSSGKDVENQLISIRDILADTNNDWEKRAEAVRRINSNRFVFHVDHCHYLSFSLVKTNSFNSSRWCR